ncbi:MAG: M61 family metallopeptidase [Woeseia sp.]
MPALPHQYSIRLKNPGAHLFEVRLLVAKPDPAGQVFSVPAWIPGSYMVRDFAKHVVGIRARSDDREIELVKVDKSSWQAAACESPITLIADVYAYDHNVRGAHFDNTHAYFNGPSVFPSVVGQEGHVCELDIRPMQKPVGRNWRVVTSMRPKTAPKYGFGVYESDNYAELIDHPVEIGNLAIGEFEASGIPHTIAIRGKIRVDMGRVCHDLKTLCRQHMRLLGVPKDLDRYVFLVMALGDGYGGLEHRWSSSLLCSRSDLPKRGDSGIDERYRKFLGLCSHEYFHLWNVKRMKPQVFTPYDLSKETHTGLLWVFEGVTSYYDDLALVRSELVSAESYLEVLGKTITRVMRARGRFRQSIEESSFDAWTKFYKQDANSSNAIVSYYTKGALVALALDLTLRLQTRGGYCLDDVMRECWKQYGETGAGMPERGLESVATTMSGTDLGDFFDRYVRGTHDLPLEQLLSKFGVKLTMRPAEDAGDEGGKAAKHDKKPHPWLGATLVNRNGRDLFKLVHSGSPAEQGGISPADEAVAIDGLKLTASNVDRRLQGYRAGDTAQVSVFRGDELLRCSVRLEEPPADTCYLQLAADPDKETETRRNAWLTGD